MTQATDTTQNQPEVLGDPSWTGRVTRYRSKTAYQRQEEQAVYIIQTAEGDYMTGQLGEEQDAPFDFAWTNLWMLTSQRYGTFIPPARKVMAGMLAEWLEEQGYEVTNTSKGAREDHDEYKTHVMKAQNYLHRAQPLIELG